MRAKHLAEVRALRLVGVGHNHPPGAVLGQVEQVEGREPRARRGAGQASSASSSSALLLDPLTAARSQMRTTRARSFRGVRADARAGQPGIRGKRPAMAEGGDGHFGLSRQAGLVAAPGCRSGDHTPLHVQVRPSHTCHELPDNGRDPRGLTQAGERHRPGPRLGEPEELAAEGHRHHRRCKVPVQHEQAVRQSAAMTVQQADREPHKVPDDDTGKTARGDQGSTEVITRGNRGHHEGQPRSSRGATEVITRGKPRSSRGANRGHHEGQPGRRKDGLVAHFSAEC